MHRYSTPAQGEAFDVIDRRARELRSPSPQQDQVQPANEELQGISRLFGIDAEQYLLEHVEQYEAMRKRWTTCDLEEWKNGADGRDVFSLTLLDLTCTIIVEMTAKFAGIVDFVSFPVLILRFAVRLLTLRLLTQVKDHISYVLLPQSPFASPVSY